MFFLTDLMSPGYRGYVRLTPNRFYPVIATATGTVTASVTFRVPIWNIELKVKLNQLGVVDHRVEGQKIVKQKLVNKGQLTTILINYL